MFIQFHLLTLDFKKFQPLIWVLFYSSQSVLNRCYGNAFKGDLNFYIQFCEDSALKK
jgi:hypothetical protein